MAQSRSGSRTTTDHDEIRRWVEERGGKPVEVAATAPMPSGALVVVSPGGYRVEGLDFATASALLRALR